mmetsp:Transcript_98924/g.285508  ORF Transcript_98924/g.285508 Transcript_98924/m.285508 type:complete len:975 (+) Transcript_98924:130-3054(+)
MYRDINEGRDAKITEKSEKARKEFFQKCEKIKKGAAYNEKKVLEIANNCALEYLKVFGRIGVHPLLHLKGGKKRPRYMIDRDETWVIYKPALWQMGGQPSAWRDNLLKIQQGTKSLKEAEDKYLASEKAETMQEWHVLETGMLWLPPDRMQDFRGWGFIQRLDLETDGPVIIAKTWRNMRALQVQMKLHVNHKAYMCLVHGRMENKTVHAKRKFAELGSDASTQVMLQNDAVNDPFFDWSSGGKWSNRSVRMAETFFTPLAYYHRKEDNSDYTLVYVNILTGITHQIRITMQSFGHPLVSDDRYLPRDQAMADLKWCPRNFLVEVRADFFDVTGPHKDPEHRNYTRISLENPLPQMFQNILTKKLILTEVLDPTADLFVGPRYWAIGDYELMSAYPKDDDYRKKVMRWGQRRGIHLDALNRLLMLSKDDIDDVLNNYRPPSELGAEAYTNWICPVCMHWNTPEEVERQERNNWGEKKIDPDVCRGGGRITALGKDCKGRRQVNEDKVKSTVPEGWLNYVKDPTIHFLYLVNAKWLEARRTVMKNARPSWERAPDEAEGTIATPEMLVVLEEALVDKAKKGELGLHESDLVTLPGLEDIQFPLGLPPECDVQRVRLPGCGSQSQWVYTLKAFKRIDYTSVFDAKAQRLQGPLFVKTDELPPKQIRRKTDEASSDSNGKVALKTAGSWDWSSALSAATDEEPPEKKQKVSSSATRKWERRESKSNPGKFYFVNTVTGESSVEKPQDMEDNWEMMISKSSGKSYYFNHATGESRVEKPEGMEDTGSAGEAALLNMASGGSTASQPKADEGIKWERRESTSKPGSYYYFNPTTGDNEITPPVVEFPWTLVESKSKRGQKYYYNEVTAESTVDPPRSAKPAPKKANDTKANGSSSPPGRLSTGAVNGKQEKLPAGWTRKESEKYQGKFYYTNSKTGETSWTKPSPWERAESNSNPGKFYYINCETGETSWTKQVVGIAS